MNMIEQVEPFGISHFDKDVASLLIGKVGTYISDFPDIFPSRQYSLELLDKIRTTGLMDRMTIIELKGEHFPLSHAAVVTQFASGVARQLNLLCAQRIGTFIVDEPLITSAALIHDIGKVINPTDIETLGLNHIDITHFTAHFPETASSKEIGSNDILKTIALILSFGTQFEEHAKVAAHSIYHLVYDPDIHIERFLLMLADFSVVNIEPQMDIQWPKAGMTSSLVHRLDEVMSKYGGTRDEYLRFYFILEAIKSNMEKAGILFPPSLGQPDFGVDPESIHFSSVLKLLDLLNVKRRSI